MKRASKAGVERETGFEPATPSLEGWCSSQLSYSRTLILDSGFCIPARLVTRRIGRRNAERHPFPDARPTIDAAPDLWWREEDSNLRRPKASRFTVCPV